MFAGGNSSNTNSSCRTMFHDVDQTKQVTSSSVFLENSGETSMEPLLLADADSNRKVVVFGFYEFSRRMEHASSSGDICALLDENE